VAATLKPSHAAESLDRARQSHTTVAGTHSPVTSTGAHIRHRDAPGTATCVLNSATAMLLPTDHEIKVSNRRPVPMSPQGDSRSVGTHETRWSSMAPLIGVQPALQPSANRPSSFLISLTATLTATGDTPAHAHPRRELRPDCRGRRRSVPPPPAVSPASRDRRCSWSRRSASGPGRP